MTTEVLYDQFDSDSWAEYALRLSIYDKWLVQYVGKENNDWHWHPISNGVIFEREEDAVAFKLKFEI